MKWVDVWFAVMVPSWSSIILILTCDLTGVNSGMMGLSMAYALNLMGLFQFSIRQTAEVEMQVRWSIKSVI